MAEAAEKLSKKQVMRYATEQLHAVRPQPAGIPDMLAALQDALNAADDAAEAEKEEAPPKDVKEAIGRIDAAVGKMEHPPKEKPDLNKMVSEPPKEENKQHAIKPAK